MVMRPGVFEIMKAVFHTQDSIKLSEKADAIICYVSIFCPKPLKNKLHRPPGWTQY